MDVLKINDDDDDYVQKIEMKIYLQVFHNTSNNNIERLFHLSTYCE